MNNPIDRADCQYLANEIGVALSELNKMTKVLAPIFRTLKIGENPGQFEIL